MKVPDNRHPNSEKCKFKPKDTPNEVNRFQCMSWSFARILWHWRHLLWMWRFQLSCVFTCFYPGRINVD